MNDNINLTFFIILFLCVLIMFNPQMNNCQLTVYVVAGFIVYLLFNMVMNVESFSNYNNGNGEVYKTSCKHNWKKEPCDNKLNDTMGFTQFGSSVPLKSTETELSSDHKTYPSVDGVGDKNSMFMFAYNKASPECCPSSYSTSTGCVCSTDNQIDY